MAYGYPSHQVQFATQNRYAWLYRKWVPRSAARPVQVDLDFLQHLREIGYFGPAFDYRPHPGP